MQRRLRLLDQSERCVAEGFQASDGRIVVLALGVTMTPGTYRTIEKALEDWGRVSVEWLDGAEEVAANSDARSVVK